MRAGIAHAHHVHLAWGRRTHVENVDVGLSPIVQPHLPLVRCEGDAVARDPRWADGDRGDHVPGDDIGEREAAETNDVVDHQRAATVDREWAEDPTAAVPGDGGHNPIGGCIGHIYGPRGRLRLHEHALTVAADDGVVTSRRQRNAVPWFACECFDY